MLSKGVPYIVESLGEPLREEQGDGFWDIDVYEIPRTLYFPGVTVVTRDYVDDAVNFDLEAAQVRTGNGIYERRCAIEKITATRIRAPIEERATR